MSFKNVKKNLLNPFEFLNYEQAAHLLTSATTTNDREVDYWLSWSGCVYHIDFCKALLYCLIQGEDQDMKKTVVSLILSSFW